MKTRYQILEEALSPSDFARVKLNMEDPNVKSNLYSWLEEKSDQPANRLLGRAFLWITSPEGAAYWRSVKIKDPVKVKMTRYDAIKDILEDEEMVNFLVCYLKDPDYAFDSENDQKRWLFEDQVSEEDAKCVIGDAFSWSAASLPETDSFSYWEEICDRVENS